MTNNSIIMYGRSILLAEADALTSSAASLSKDFEDAVELVASLKSKVVITGVGKSAIVARKLAATFSSLRIPACYMHAADGPHGDVGMVTYNDVVIFLSLSGENTELFGNFAAIKKIGARTMCITGNPKSTLAKACEIVVLVKVPQEAGELAVAPTASTVAMIGIGDAIGLAAAKLRGLTLDEFAQSHPGGALGRRLLTRVADLTHLEGRVYPESGLLEVVEELSRSRLGAVAVMDRIQKQKLLGLITEGDFRRAVGNEPHRFTTLKAEDIMTLTPRTVNGDTLAVDALRAMESNEIQVSVLPVLDDAGSYLGLVRFHDLLSFT